MREGSLRSLLRITRSARRLTGRERAEACDAFVWLVTVRVLLAVLPYARARKLLSGIATGPPRGRMDAPACARAVGRAAHLVPGSRCLARSLATECLLRRHGHAAALRLGVRFADDGELEAHAWIESGGASVGTGNDAGRYTPLAPPPLP